MPRAFLLAGFVCLATAPVILALQAPSPAAGVPVAAPEISGPAAEVLAFEQKMERAVVDGDAASVDRVLSKDFILVDGDHWATAGRAQVIEDRAALLKHVTDKTYLVRDLDQVRAEVHGDVAITYGRYVSMAAGHGGKPAGLSSTWFERVYAKRNGQWQFLSHRTVHAATPAPAGIDPSVALTGPDAEKAWYATDPAPASMAHTDAELLQMDQKVGTAVVNGDVAYVQSVTPADFVMVHGDGWTYGGKPLLTDTQASMLKRVAGKSYSVLDFDQVTAEMHGDVAITFGRYLAHTTASGPPERSWFSVWFERVYARREGRWIYLSHRTVHGPTFGGDRKAVSDK